LRRTSQRVTRQETLLLRAMRPSMRTPPAMRLLLKLRLRVKIALW
jgi:hypothetical protein